MDGVFEKEVDFRHGRGRGGGEEEERRRERETRETRERVRVQAVERIGEQQTALGVCAMTHDVVHKRKREEQQPPRKGTKVNEEGSGMSSCSFHLGGHAAKRSPPSDERQHGGGVCVQNGAQENQLPKKPSSEAVSAAELLWGQELAGEPDVVGRPPRFRRYTTASTVSADAELCERTRPPRDTPRPILSLLSRRAPPHAQDFLIMHPLHPPPHASRRRHEVWSLGPTPSFSFLPTNENELQPSASDVTMSAAPESGGHLVTSRLHPSLPTDSFFNFFLLIIVTKRCNPTLRGALPHFPRL